MLASTAVAWHGFKYCPTAVPISMHTLRYKHLSAIHSPPFGVSNRYHNTKCFIYKCDSTFETTGVLSPRQSQTKLNRVWHGSGTTFETGLRELPATSTCITCKSVERVHMTRVHTWWESCRSSWSVSIGSQKSLYWTKKWPTSSICDTEPTIGDLKERSIRCNFNP